MRLRVEARVVGTGRAARGARRAEMPQNANANARADRALLIAGLVAVVSLQFGATILNEVGYKLQLQLGIGLGSIPGRCLHDRVVEAHVGDQHAL